MQAEPLDCLYKPACDSLPSPCLPIPAEIEHMIRSVKYTFPASFLSFKTVRTA